MANLIIKSSADNLVLQGSDASPAITVGATGTTTFAENATLSGTANNLGTSTAGTFTSGVTFPNGHVLQVVYGTDTTGGAIATTTYTDTGLTASITPSDATNKILVTWTMHANMQADNRGYGTKLLRDDGGGYDALYTSAVLYDVYSNHDVGGDPRMRGSWAFLDTPGVTVATGYKIQAATHSSGSCQFNEGGSMTYITLMEVVA